MENFKYVYLVISILLTIHLLMRIWSDIRYNFPFFVKKFGKETFNEKGEKYWVLRLPFIAFVMYETKKKK